MNQSSDILTIVRAIIPLIEDRNTQRQIAKSLNKPQAWVSRKTHVLLKMNLIEKRGNTRSSFYVVNHAILNSLIQSLRGAEDGPGEKGRIHNVIIKYRMLQKPHGLNEKTINLTNWRKYQAKYGGITVEWSDNVKVPFFLIRYPIVHAINFIEAEREIFEKSRNLAADISENHGLIVEATPSVKYGEIAFKGDPVAKAVCNFGNYDNGRVKIDQSEGEPEHEFHGSGDEIFKRADDYFSLPARVGEVEKVLREFKGDTSENMAGLRGETAELAREAGLNQKGYVRNPALEAVYRQIKQKGEVHHTDLTKISVDLGATKRGVKEIKENQAITSEHLAQVVDTQHGFSVNIKEHGGAIKDIRAAAQNLSTTSKAQEKTAEGFGEAADALTRGLESLTQGGQHTAQKRRGGNGRAITGNPDAKRIFRDVV